MSAIRRFGERALLVELEGGHEAVHRLAQLTRHELGEHAEDVVPGHRTVLVVGRWGAPDAALLTRLAAQATAGPSEREAADGETIEIAVRYDGPDLTEVAELCGLSRAEVVRRHLAPTYRVAFVGFAPGFAYLVGGDPQLAVPRRDEPRTKVPAGSVAIAGPYSTVYPAASPGGWRLLGRSDAVLFDPQATRPSLLTGGSLVRFRESG